MGAPKFPPGVFFLASAGAAFVILLLAALSLYGLRNDRDQLLARHEQLQSRLEEFRKDRDGLAASEGKLRDELKSLRDGEQAELKLLRADFEGLKSELAKMKTASEAAGAALVEVKGRMEEAGANLKGGSTKLDSTLADVASLGRKLEETNRAIAALGKAQEASDARSVETFRQLAQALTLLSAGKASGASVTSPAGSAGTPVQPPDAARSAARPAGDKVPGAARVVTTGSKDGAHFVVVSLGFKDGVQKGQEMEIRRGDARIAHAQVSRVDPDLCGARITFQEAGQEIRAGDQVVFVR
jgi:hypothetical protein